MNFVLRTSLYVILKPFIFRIIKNITLHIFPSFKFIFWNICFVPEIWNSVKLCDYFSNMLNLKPFHIIRYDWNFWIFNLYPMFKLRTVNIGYSYLRNIIYNILHYFLTIIIGTYLIRFFSNKFNLLARFSYIKCFLKLLFYKLSRYIINLYIIILFNSYLFTFCKRFVVFFYCFDFLNILMDLFKLKWTKEIIHSWIFTSKFFRIFELFKILFCFGRRYYFFRWIFAWRFFIEFLCNSHEMLHFYFLYWPIFSAINIFIFKAL